MISEAVQNAMLDPGLGYNGSDTDASSIPDLSDD
jgi:hypothetical protein